MFTSDLIHFHYLYPPFYFPNRVQLKTFLHQLAISEKHDINSLTYVFCSDEYLQNFNQQYLQHTELTDIITFQLNKSLEPILADIYISIDRVKENASLFSTSFKMELHRVIFHGLLHCCGYKDKKKNDQEIMRKKEQFYLSQYFVSRETI